MFGNPQVAKSSIKKSIHNYPQKSYLPIFDSIQLECRSLLHMYRNKFYVGAEKSIMQGS